LDLDADKRAFVDAVMAPLGEDPFRRELLEECLAVAETYPCAREGDSIEAATQRMQATARSFRGRSRLVLLLPALLLLVAAWFSILGLPAWKSLDRIYLANRMSAGWSSMCCTHEGVPDSPRFGKEPARYEDERPLRRVISRMDPEQRLLLLGDLSATTEDARWKAVWDRYPHEPAHFLAYAIKYHKVHKQWPPDLVETGEKLDPGNGWFRFIAAEEKIELSIGVPPPARLTPEERRARGAKPPVKPPKPERVILKPAVFAEGQAMLEQALAMPRWDDYFVRLEQIRFEATPVAEDFGAHAAGHVLAICQPEDWANGWLELRAYNDAFALAAAQAAKDGDRERLDQLGKLLRQTGQHLADMPADYVARMVARNLQVNGGRAIAKAWDDLDERAKARPFEDLVRDLDPKRHPRPTLPPDALDEHRASGFVLKSYSGMREPYSTAVTEPELRGGRLAEYAMYERFVVHAGAAFAFLVALVLALAMRRDRKLLGSLPLRLTDLLRPSDRWRILALGLLLPLAVYLLFTRGEWLAPRGTGVNAQRFFLWLLQVISLGISVILLTLYLTRHCLHHRGGMLAMELRGARHMLWMGGLSLALIPIAALLPRVMDRSGYLTMICWVCAGFMAGMPFLWLLNLAACQFGGNPARRLHRALLLPSLLWPMALLMLLAAVAIPILQSEERRWIAHLDYEKLAPQNNVITPRPEREHGDWINAETKRALESLK
jgi:hypothetical protein